MVAFTTGSHYPFMFTETDEIIKFADLRAATLRCLPISIPQHPRKEIRSHIDRFRRISFRFAQ